jgi:septum formation protein
VSFEVDPADVDETPHASEPAAAYVQRLAVDKAKAVAVRHEGDWVLAADTSVVVEGRILGKPRDPTHALEMLGELSGQTHTVMTAVALAGRQVIHRVVRTRVHFRKASQAELAWYVGTKEPLDKAGAYALQGAGGFLVRGIDGSSSNVIGLPLVETVELLTEAGFPLPWTGVGA